MAATFKTRIRQTRFTLSPFSPEQMMNFGQSILDAKLTRIRKGINSQDAPAKALSRSYAAQKVSGRRVPPNTSQKYKGQGIRDWKLRGWTMASAKVKSASSDKVTIGFVNSFADKIITVQRRMSEQWSDSPSDLAALNKTVIEQLHWRNPVRLTRAG